MSSSSRALAIAATMGLLALPAAGQSPAGPTMTVDGQAEIRVVPDEVVLTLGVETDASEILAATKANEERVAAVVAAALQAGVPRDRVRTEYLQIEPRWRELSDRRVFLGYFARRSLSITLRDLSAFEPLLSSVLTAGANYVHGVEFRTTELRKHRDEARRLALVAAHEKAQAMSAALGQRIGAAIRVQEGNSGWWSPYSHWWGSRGGGMAFQNVVQETGRTPADSDGVVPGQISVTASVNVTFELTK
jgi:uncharacterized protein YggE